ncbi:hypothetical protein UFOVP318_26 [uncultured Caudovirales phage]|uniref:PD-(D/E)XK nuclease superfamily n=1 Tax=uncultured Caudovirales phage TaxID=2100421 RepID=A0A6J5LSH4_9CAUD|nr:hypothetical protein UFOVP318_26 [uncultured Caudovirales phage]
MYTINNKQLTFLDARFYQTQDGNYVPSVTHILDCYPKGAAYFNWLKENGKDADEIRDEAGRRGSVVHKLTELYDAGDEVNLVNPNGSIDYKLNEWAMFERYVEFRKRFNFTTDCIELNIISKELGYAGTLDRVITLDGKKILLDIKTSNAIYPSYWLQLAAYRSLLLNSLGQRVDMAAILWLNAKTRTEGKKGDIQGIGWQLITKEDCSKDLELFNATHQLWIAENENSKPKQLTYQISHKL